MSKTRVIVGVLLAGFLGPGLGITANVLHKPWLNIPALCILFAGLALIWREKARR